jgi:hypothetical protein
MDIVEEAEPGTREMSSSRDLAAADVSCAEAKCAASACEQLPHALDMDFVMVDIEAPPLPVISDEEWDDEEDDGWLLQCFTLSTAFCAGFLSAIQTRFVMCGIYLRDRRFWVCKVIILIMDMAILRGAISMGEEYCTQDDEISEFGWILWSSFLVFCKFVYLRPVFHLHQLGVFHSSRRDAGKSALIELLCLICHVSMLSALLLRTSEPGFSAYRTASCSARGRKLVPTISQCSRAADWYSLSSKSARLGENRTVPLSMQPPGCYYSNSEQQLYFNPLICNEAEQWCRDWVTHTFASCTKESACLCECTFTSLAVLLSVIIFAMPMPLQWRMLHSSVLKVLERPRSDPLASLASDAANHASAQAESSEVYVCERAARARVCRFHLQSVVGASTLSFVTCVFVCVCVCVCAGLGRVGRRR